MVDPEPEESVAAPARSKALALHEIDGEPLVLDEDLGRELGMVRPTNIRRNIEANREELEGYGDLHEVRVKSSDPLGRGRPSTAYYLNEEQALLLCMFSGAEKAKEIRKQVIAVYQAWRKGHLRPVEKPQEPTTPSIPTDFASALRLAADEHERRLRLEAEKVVLIEERNEAFVRVDKAEAEQR